MHSSQSAVHKLPKSGKVLPRQVFRSKNQSSEILETSGGYTEQAGGSSWHSVCSQSVGMPRIQELTPGYDYYMDAQEDVRRHGLDAEVTSGREKEAMHARLENDKTYATVDLPKSMEKIQNDYDHAFEVARDEYVKSSESDRKAQIEYDRQRDELYNRLGENWAQERSDYEKRIGNYGEEIDFQKEQYQKMRDEADKHFERKMEAINDRNSVETEKIVQEARQQVRDNYRLANQGSDNGGAAAYERKLQQQFDDMNRARNDELREIKDREMEHADQWALMGRKRDMAEQESYAEHQEALQNLQKRYDEDFDTYKRAVKQEQSDLYRQNMELSTLRDKYGDGIAQGRQAAIQEMADERKSDAGRVEDAWREREAQLSRQNSELYEELGRKNSEALRDKDIFYSDIIQKTNSEYYDDRNAMGKAYTDNVEEIKTGHAEREKALEDRYNESVDTLQKQSNEAMVDQARTFRENFNASKVQNAHDMDMLQAKVNYLMSTDDPAAVSPAAAERIRVSLADEHEKSFQAYDEALQGEVEYIRQDAQDQVTDLQEQLDHERYRSASTIASKEKEHNDAFVNFATEMTDARDSAIRRQEMAHERAWDKAYKSFTSDMRYKDRQYSQAMEDLKDNNDSKLRDLLTEAQFRERTLRSEQQMAQEDTIRAYERKLADQKEQYETTIDEMKHEQMVNARKTEREYQELLREQEQRHAHELATAELQRKERERYMAQNYEDQLERTQRANARLVQAKS